MNLASRLESEQKRAANVKTDPSLGKEEEHPVAPSMASGRLL